MSVNNLKEAKKVDKIRYCRSFCKGINDIFFFQIKFRTKYHSLVLWFFLSNKVNVILLTTYYLYFMKYR